MTHFRVGHGYDVHAFTQGTFLTLGGVKIPYIKTLHGHSDADALTHALCDALLGACGLPDIGQHFPDTAEEFKNINSLILLKRVVEMIKVEGWQVENADVTIIAEHPKIGPHVEDMRHMLGPILRDSGGPGFINIKATTHEGLGPLGRGEGIAVHAVALLQKPQ